MFPLPKNKTVFLWEKQKVEFWAIFRLKTAKDMSDPQHQEGTRDQNQQAPIEGTAETACATQEWHKPWTPRKNGESIGIYGCHGDIEFVYIYIIHIYIYIHMTGEVFLTWWLQ